ncbi:MAG: hypothetical protein OEU36_19340 [Gammaproteobacteria bacterium]|nr:hypothetical protein [Gammaproteobacteria bacterium]
MKAQKPLQYSMNPAGSQVTLLLGPQTRLTHALNDAVRMHGDFISDAGVTAITNRNASSTLRAAAAESLSDSERRATLESGLSLNEGDPVFFSAINFLGPPADAFRKLELFPNSGRMISGRNSVLSTMVSRVVITIEPLHHFLFYLPSPTLHKRVAESPWEALFEISWSDLISELCEAFPLSRILVMTPDAALMCTRSVLSELFGSASCEIDPALLQRPHLTLVGQEALTRLSATHDPAPEILKRVFVEHRDTPDSTELEMRIGVDKLTSTLLDQRFLEDLHDIELLKNVQLLPLHDW